MDKRLSGKVAFVTGAATGMGQAMAVRLASEGALVGVNHLPNVDPSETLKRIKDAGGEGFPVVQKVVFVSRSYVPVIHAGEPPIFHDSPSHVSFPGSPFPGIV